MSHLAYVSAAYGAALLAIGKHPWQRRLALEELIAQRLSLRRSSLAARTERVSGRLPAGITSIEPREVVGSAGERHAADRVAEGTGRHRHRAAGRTADGRRG